MSASSKQSHRPIGVFDSGLGGLTVFKALRARMPEEDLIYFGDTAHLPYGNKTPETVTRYSLEVARYLAGLRIKAMVVACNTASALALRAVQRALPVPVLGVIVPGSRAAAAATRNGRVGVIGTEATIASGAYTRALRHILPGVKVSDQACPLFVPLVETGWWRHPVTDAVAKEYLGPLKKRGIDTLILGCTHYPLLKPVLARQAGPGIQLIDSAEETARETEDLLESLRLRRSAGKGASRFFVSDGPERFLGFARRLLGPAVRSVGVRRIE